MKGPDVETITITARQDGRQATITGKVDWSDKDPDLEEWYSIYTEKRRHIYAAYITTPEELATTAVNLALSTLKGRSQ